MPNASHILSMTLGLAILAPTAASATPSGLFIDLRDDTTDADERAIEAKLGGLDIRLNSVHSADERFFVVDVPASDIERLLRKIQDDPRVEFAEPNYTYRLPRTPASTEQPAPTDGEQPQRGPAPNDPLFSKQWSFQMVDVQSAWAQADGSGAVVAVIDTGVAYQDRGPFKKVEDLASTEFVDGYDFVNDRKEANDDHGHGTHVAGTIAQSTNNGLGVAGLAPKAKIMPLKVLSARGSGSAADIADAIRFAADEGANVINMSLGGGLRSLIMQNAVAYARKKGVIVVCAAGNNARGKVEFPAAYKGAFAVSSVGPTGKLAFYSSYGKHLAMSAPGGDKQLGGDAGAILQNTITPDKLGVTNQYLAFQGTSMATPHVAGAAALIISAGVTAPDDVERILKETSRDAGPAGWDARYGYGVLDAGRAVQAAAQTTSGPWQFAGSIFAVLAFAWRWRKRIALAKLLPGALVGGVIGGSGLFFLAGVLPAVFTTAMPMWDLMAFGPSFHTPIWVSVLPVFLLSVAALSVRPLRAVLIGLALGWAVHLLAGAFMGATDVAWLPGVAGTLDRLWLLLNAAGLGLLATLLTRVTARVMAR